MFLKVPIAYRSSKTCADFGQSTFISAAPAPVQVATTASPKRVTSARPGSSRSQASKVATPASPTKSSSPVRPTTASRKAVAATQEGDDSASPSRTTGARPSTATRTAIRPSSSRADRNVVRPSSRASASASSPAPSNEPPMPAATPQVETPAPAPPAPETTANESIAPLPTNTSIPDPTSRMETLPAANPDAAGEGMVPQPARHLNRLGSARRRDRPGSSSGGVAGVSGPGVGNRSKGIGSVSGAGFISGDGR